MKTKAIIFTMMALVFVFITDTIEAQTVVSTEVFTEGDYATSDVSDNNTFVNIAVTLVNDHNGQVRTMEKQVDGTFTLVNTYDLIKGNGSSDAVNGVASTISNLGMNFVVYMYGWSGDDGLIRLQKNIPDGSTVTIFEYVNDGIATMKAVDDDLYTIFGVGENFDPGTLGNLPNLSSGYHLLKVDGTNNQYDWSISLGSSFVWNSDVEFIVNPIDEENIYLITATGDLIKYRKSDGTNLGTVLTGSDGDKYKFDEDGNLHFLDVSEHSLSIYDGSNNYALLCRTDWMQWNLWGSTPKDWKITDERLYGATGSEIIHLSNDLIHGYKENKNSQIDTYGTGYNVWVNDDTSYGYVMVDGSIINILTVIELNEDTSLLPTLNDSDPDIVAVVDGQTYDGTQWNNAYHQGTIVFANGTLPSVGDTPSEDWVNIPDGTHLLGFNDIEENLRPEGGLIFRMGVRKDGTTDVRNLKVLLVEESDVVLDNYTISIEKTSDGAEPSSNVVFTINVSPVNNSGSVITGDITYSGTATEGEDYEGIASFSIPDGSSSAVITLITNDDTLYEGTETIVAEISNISKGNASVASASANLEDDETSSIEDISSNDVAIYPNPAKDIIYLKSDLNINLIQIYDISGKLCFQEKPLSTKPVNISSLKPGVYFMKIFVGEQVATKKFIKNNY